MAEQDQNTDKKLHDQVRGRDKNQQKMEIHSNQAFVPRF